jgi:hypothetical protein
MRILFWRICVHACCLNKYQMPAYLCLRSSYMMHVCPSFPLVLPPCASCLNEYRYNNNLSAEGVKALAAALHHVPQLQVLNLRCVS